LLFPCWFLQRETLKRKALVNPDFIFRLFPIARDKEIDTTRIAPNAFPVRQAGAVPPRQVFE